MVWKLGRVVAASTRSTSISYVSKPTITGPSPLAIIRRNPRDVSVIYAADKFHINTPEHHAQVLRMFNFCWVRMAGAFKIHLIPSLKSSKLVKQFFELTNIIPENVKNF